MKHPRATKTQALSLYQQGWRLAAIAAETGVSERTLREWRDTEAWSQTISPEEALEARLSWLIAKDDKIVEDWREMKFLAELRKKYMRRADREAGRTAAGHPGKGGRAGRGRRNDIDGIDLDEIEGPAWFGYQQDYLDDLARFRFYIKSRQIGFTYVASWDALTDAIRNGRNQIFLSASKNQVGMFRDYVRLLAKRYIGLDLKGNKEKIDLHRDGELWASFYFLSTNTATAQSYHGNVIIDEACWIPQYETLRKVAGGMASQKRYRTSIFSTPSTVTHAAWIEFKRLAKQQAEKPSARVSLRTITIHDAIEQGCDLFELEHLREEYDEAAFSQLFECQPLDDELSVFKLAELEALQVDPDSWPQPAGAPVWIGYDPSRTTDAASLSVVVRTPGGMLRRYESERFRGKSIRYQADRIRDYIDRYNVQHVAIDATGIGQGVFDLVAEFFPKATAINYTLENKVALVVCMRHLVSEKRLELPAGDTLLLHAFLAIKQTVTGGGRITYKAARTAETGHADDFFSFAHACQFEPIRTKKRKVLIYS